MKFNNKMDNMMLKKNMKKRSVKEHYSFEYSRDNSPNYKLVKKDNKYNPKNKKSEIDLCTKIDFLIVQNSNIIEEIKGLRNDFKMLRNDFKELLNYLIKRKSSSNSSKEENTNIIVNKEDSFGHEKIIKKENKRGKDYGIYSGNKRLYSKVYTPLTRPPSFQYKKNKAKIMKREKSTPLFKNSSLSIAPTKKKVILNYHIKNKKDKFLFSKNIAFNNNTEP